MTLEQLVQRLYYLSLAQWVAILLLSGALAVIVINGRSASAHRNDALRTVICDAESAEIKNPKITQKQKDQAVSFWTHTLQNAHLAPCTFVP